MGANCRHNWFIFFEGISKRNYTKEELNKLKNETVTYNGEEMPVWKARDKQRAYERNIRSIKEQLVAFDEASKNVLTTEEQLLWKAEINNLSVKLKSGEAELKDFCSQTGLTRDRFREQVFATQTENGIKNFGKSVSQKAVQSARRKYKDFLSVVGVDNAPETLDKYYDLKYNKPKEFDELKRFYKFRLDNPNSTKQHFYCVEDIKKHFKCEKVYLPTYDIDVDKLEFDSLHINKQRKHNVTEQQAKSFIRNSPITFEKYNGDSLIYVSEGGASYVLKSKNLIRTSFSNDEFDDAMKNVIEELKKHGYI